MKSLAKFWIPVAVAALLLAPLTSATVRAQGNDVIKPIAVVSLANIDEQFADVGYLLKAAGLGQFGVFVEVAKGELITGLNTTQPAGAYVTLSGEEPQIVGFVAVTDFDAALAKLTQQLGEPEDLGKGVLKLTGPQGNAVFLKERDGWVFGTNAVANLDTLPVDPVKLLGGLDKQYNIAAQINVQNIPQEMKDVAIASMKLGLVEALERGEVDENRAAVEAFGKNAVEAIEQLIEETDQVTLGWSVDSMAKSTFIDIAFTAVEGTTLAAQMATMENSKSDYTGFLSPDAAASLNAVAKLTATDIESFSLILKTVREGAMQGLDEEGDLNDEQRAAAKEVLGTLFDVGQKTVDSGKLDMGAALLLSPEGLTVVAGGYVADGAALDKAFKQVIKLAEQEPDFPGVKLNAEQHGDVHFHTMNIPVPENEREARQLLGETLEVAVGFSGKSIYVAFGKNSLSTLKDVIDKSKAGAGKVVPAGQFNIALTPILRFAASVTDDEVTHELAELISASKGNDKISITSDYIPNGTRMRLKVDEGILKLVGEAAKKGLQGGGGSPF